MSSRLSSFCVTSSYIDTERERDSCCAMSFVYLKAVCVFYAKSDSTGNRKSVTCLFVLRPVNQYWEPEVRNLVLY